VLSDGDCDTSRSGRFGQRDRYSKERECGKDKGSGNVHLEKDFEALERQLSFWTKGMEVKEYLRYSWGFYIRGRDILEYIITYVLLRADAGKEIMSPNRVKTSSVSETQV
jgi:hypothetical protein